MFRNKFVEYEREDRGRRKIKEIQDSTTKNNDDDDFNIIHHINDQEENEIIVDQNYEANYWTDLM